MTREQSTKKQSGHTVLILNMLKIDDSMNEACANNVKMVVNKLQRRKVSF